MSNLSLYARLIFIWLIINNCMGNMDCNDSPIRKPPRFGKRLTDDFSMIRAKAVEPCFERMSTRSENDGIKKPNDNDLTYILLSEWMKRKFQNINQK
jgi:hypothetical protein